MQRRRIRLVALVALVALLGIVPAVSGCSTRSGRATGSGADVARGTYIPPTQRRSAPGLSGRTLAGPRYALSQARGHVLVVNVWASWCSVCRKESRGLGRLSAALGSTTVRFVGIDEQDVDGSGRAFARTSGTMYPQLADPDGTMLATLTLLPRLGIPSTLLIDRHGRMAARIIGAADETVLRNLIDRVAAEH